VGGGSLLSLLGVWRAHGIDSMLREAYEAGVILCGLSAGSLCWFAEAVSGYHGEVNRVPALGFLRHSNAVHYGDGDRRGAFHSHLLDGMPAGYAAEDGAALRFVGDELVEVVASRPEARAYKLELRGNHVLETRLATRYLGAEAPAAVMRGYAAGATRLMTVRQAA
jgi:dipeptidase E